MGQTTLRQTNARSLAAAVEYLSDQPDVVLVYLFGSQARSQARPRSDTDVALLLDPEGDSLERRLELWNAVEQRIKGPVDLVLLNRSPLLLQQQVLKYGQVLYERSQGERIAYEVYVLKLGHDLKPIQDAQWANLRQAIKEGRFGQRGRCPVRAVEAT